MRHFKIYLVWDFKFYSCPAGAFVASRYGTSCLKKSFRFPIMAALDDSNLALELLCLLLSLISYNKTFSMILGAFTLKSA